MNFNLNNDQATRIVSESEAQTLAIGRAIGEMLNVGDSVLLYGEMGAGKTCMARGITQGAECEVSARSPTFIILAEYPGKVRIFHCDLYRLTSADEIHELALEETIERGALLVEWPENAAGALPQDALETRIEPEPATQNRTITMIAHGPRAASLMQRTTASLPRPTST
jgi:tRNA threonylcarbamoyl adenosine modification protein YjeE